MEERTLLDLCLWFPHLYSGVTFSKPLRPVLLALAKAPSDPLPGGTLDTTGISAAGSPEWRDRKLEVSILLGDRAGNREEQTQLLRQVGGMAVFIMSSRRE